MPEWINYANKRVSKSSARIVWWVTGTILSITLVLAIAIGGSYAIAAHAIDTQEQQARAQGVEVCKALVILDRSGDGVVFSKPGPSEVVLQRMLHGIHDVVESSGCR